MFKVSNELSIMKQITHYGRSIDEQTLYSICRHLMDEDSFDDALENLLNYGYVKYNKNFFLIKVKDYPDDD